MLSFDNRISDAGNIINLSSIFNLGLFLCESASKNKIDASHSWIRQDLFSSSNSLKKAFVLKEILDKPKSLRSFSV